MKFFLCKKHIRIIAVLLAVSVFSGLPVFAATKAELKKQQAATQAKLDEVKSEVAELSEEAKAAQEEEERLNEQLVSLLASIDILEEEMKQQQIKIDEAQAEYEEAQAEVERQYEAMKRRVRFMYEQGDKQYIELFLSSESIADAINKADYVEKVYDFDREMLEEFQRVKEAVAEKKAYLEETMDEMVSMEDSYKEEQAELEETIAAQRAVVEDFDAKLASAKSQAKKYEQTIKKQNEEIAKIVAAEKAAAEAAAKKKREEEARRKKAEEEARKAGETNGEANLEESQAGDSGKSSGSSGAGYSASGSGTGADIANYGLQFVGNPYVAGGTSLTNGCDCSGFTQAVYSHFGYSIPRTSGSQALYGTGVSYGEAKAGDIFCYAGHVGIYLGNGTIVHASTPASGIKVTTATYRPILSIRRIA